MSKDPPPSRPTALLRVADLRGLAQLVIDGVVGVTDLVEAMHQAAGSRAGIVGPAQSGRTRGLTGLAYRAVRGTTRGIGHALDALLAVLPAGDRPARPRREAIVAAVNGVWGDHLLATRNPLAIAMTLRIGGRPYAAALASATSPVRATGRLLVLVHGLAMNDLQWRRNGHDHGGALARDLGFTSLYLHYNSGRHVSDNGSELADLLERLVATWPVPVEELVLVGHSMGGLVLRSACHAAAGRRWRALVSRLVCLGTPHHGAPLERGGRRFDAFLGLSPYVAPFARLGRTRSAGITDLRFGNVQAADWQHRDAAEQRYDDRVPTPLPRGIACFFVAATTASKVSSLRSAAIGDGLVPLASALGEHPDPAMALRVPAGRRFVATAAHHFDLLDRDDVYAQLRDWLGR